MHWHVVWILKELTMLCSTLHQRALRIISIEWDALEGQADQVLLLHFCWIVRYVPHK